MQVYSKQFDWNPETKTFTSEMSQLGKGFQLERIYPDACDVGFTMISLRTGYDVKFVETARDMIGEDLGGQWFEPTQDSLRRFPKMRGVKVLIIND